MGIIKESSAAFFKSLTYKTLFFILLFSGTVKAQFAVEQLVNPKETYLRVADSDDKALTNTPIKLTDYGLEPGDSILISSKGEWNKPGAGGNSMQFSAVFSSSSFIYGIDSLNRVRDAIEAGSDFNSSDTYESREKTDIPEDFKVFDTWITIPENASHLFYSVIANNFSDNEDIDSDLTLTISSVDQLVNYGLSSNGNGWAQTPVNLRQVESGKPITIEAWVKPANSTSDLQYVIGTSDNNSWDLAVQNGEWMVDAGAGIMSTGVSADVGTWQHVAIIFDVSSDQVHFYKNGNRTDLGQLHYNSGIRNFYIANIPDKTAGFTGVIDDVRLWKIVRSQQEIKNNRNKLIDRTSDNLFAYWKFDEGGEDIAKDLAGNRNHAKLGLPDAEWKASGAPINGYTFTPFQPPECVSSSFALSWSAASNANSYSVEIARESNQQSIVETIDAGTETSANINTGSLTEGESYVARVSAETEGGTKVTTFTRPFTVDRTSPEVSTPVAEIADDKVARFVTEASDNHKIQRVQIQIATDKQFTSIVEDAFFNSTSGYLFEGTPGTTYYARTKAFDCAGNESVFSQVSGEVTIPQNPDLTVQSVNTGSSVQSGDKLTVTFEVANTANTATDAYKWKDVIYLSEDQNVDKSDRELLVATNFQSLNANESYQNEREVTIPDGVEGDRYILVQTDQSEKMAEQDETNNTGSSGVVQVTLSPYANLQVTSFTAPDNAFSGDTINVNFTVTNTGDAPVELEDQHNAEIPNWFDTIYLSENDTLNTIFRIHGDEQMTVLDDALFVKRTEGTLEADSNYQVQADIAIPVDVSGDQYLIAYTDLRGDGDVSGDGRIYEFNNEFDNSRSESISITLRPPPDLKVSSVTTPNNFKTGEEATITYEVENQGSGETVNERWTDSFYLSEDNQFDKTEDLLLDDLTYKSDSPVQTGSSYSVSENVTIPDSLNGDYTLFVFTDHEDGVFEHTFEQNNVSDGKQITIERSPYPDLKAGDISIPQTVQAGDQLRVTYTVENLGQRDINPDNDTFTWTDYIYLSKTRDLNTESAALVKGVKQSRTLEKNGSYNHKLNITIPDTVAGERYLIVQTDGENQVPEFPDAEENISSAALSVSSYPSPDIEISSQGIPLQQLSGEELTLNWTVSNSGEGPTLETSWTESVYLSSDSTHATPHDDTLLTSIQRVESLDDGETANSSQMITLPNGFSGTYYLVIEAPETFRHEEQQSNNRFISEGIEMTIPMATDLVVDTVRASDQLQSGTNVSISWDVENRGDTTTRSGQWFDAVYLSVDNVINEDDRLLGTVERTENVDQNEIYTAQLSTTIPVFEAGAFNLLVKTDYRDGEYEHNGEQNNLTRKPVQITLANPSDLTVKMISAPNELIVNDTSRFEWEIKNTGTHVANGTITDAIFISKDTVRDQNDPLIGVMENREIELRPDSVLKHQFKTNISSKSLQNSDGGNMRSRVPGIPEGSYYILIETDIRNGIREESEKNNVKVTSQKSDVSMESLSSNNSIPVTLTRQARSYYKVDLPAGEDIKLSLTPDQNTTGSSELYIKRDSVPTRNSYLLAAKAGQQLNQNLIIPQAEGGTYYVMSYVDYHEQKNSSYTLSTEIMQLGIESVSRSQGGNNGIVTMSVRGANFQENAELLLRDNNGNEIRSRSIKRVNSTFAGARFDLRNAEIGTYDVIMENPDGTQAILNNGFQVVEGKEPELTIETSYPQKIRSRRGFFIDVTIENRGDINAYDQMLNISMLAEKWNLSQVYDTLSGEAPEVDIETTLEIPSYTRAQLDSAGIKPSDIQSEWLVVEDENLTVEETAFERLNTTIPGIGPFGDVEAYRLPVSSSLYYLPVWFAEIPAGETINFKVKVYEHDTNFGGLQHAVGFLERPESKFSRTGNPDFITTSYGYKSLAEGLEKELRKVNQAEADTVAKSTNNQHNVMVSPQEAIDKLKNSLRSFVSIEGVFTQLGVTTAGMGVAYAIGGTAAISAGGTIAGTAVTAYLLYNSFQGYANTVQDLHGAIFSQMGEGGNTFIQPSKDPNDIIGPEGAGEENWITDSTPLNYKIRFENDPEQALAAAQKVRITLPLDETMDTRTFSLGSYGFGDYQFEVPEKRARLDQQQDLSDSLGVIVTVDAGLDIENREAFWVFQSIDPETGQPPKGVNDGFLPVNDSTGAGEGFVNFTIQTHDTASTGTDIQAQADIVFDDNPVIETPRISNKLDASVPTSYLKDAPAKVDSTSFELNIEGTDQGSGINGFNLMVSKDGEPFRVIESGIKESSYIFNGESDTRYRFRTQAIDKAGHKETGTESQEIVITGTESQVEIPTSFALENNYPNPFNPKTTIPFKLAEGGKVNLTIYDVLGRVVLRKNMGNMNAGTYREALNMGRFASGVYFYELAVTNDSGQLYRDVKKLLLIK